MADLTDRDILTQARRLADLTPPADASARAVAATRAALLAHQKSARSPWRRTVLLTGSIAAVLAITFGVAALLTSTRVDAAMLLAQVATANQSYVGWVHIVTEATDPTGRKVDEASMTMHIDTATGAGAYEATIDGFRRVSLYNPGAHEAQMYDAARNEIVIEDVVPVLSDTWAARMRNYPVSLAAAVQDMKRNARSAAAPKVTERTENGLLRLDITLPPSPATAAATRPASLPTSATLWADPQTKLLRRSRYVESDGGTAVATYAYGPPAVTSLHDLGVPRDAKVIDQRATPELAALRKRLEDRVARGFGDGVTMLAEVRHFDDRLAREPASVQLSLHCNGLIFIGNYPRKTAPPANWPNPSAADVLRAYRDAPPTTALRVNPSAPDFMKGGIPSLEIPSRIWPARLSLRASSSQWQSLSDPARPGLVGVRIVNTTPDDEYRVEHTFWLDPARDDIPVEYFKVNKAGNSVARTLIRYTDPRQAPNGQWYPSRWHKYLAFDDDPIAEDDFHTDYLLFVFPNHPIDPAWFDGPTTYVAPSPSTGPSSTPTGPNPPSTRPSHR